MVFAEERLRRASSPGKILVMGARAVALAAGLLLAVVALSLSMTVRKGLAGLDAARPPVAREYASAAGGRTRAVFLYTKARSADRMNLRIRIERDGKPVFAERVPPYPRPERYAPRPGGGEHPSLFARDLDADGEPEVFLNLYWGGAHCCWWTRIYSYSEERDTYVPRNHWWGEARAYYGFRGGLRDLDGDGRPEFSGRDDRFSRLSYFSVDPIRIWSYRAGVMHDVTRRHPRQVARDALRLWRSYPEARRDNWVRELLAAWTADQYLLGRAQRTERVLARAVRHGELEGKPPQRPRSGKAWIRVLKRFLRKTGYIQS